jgi:hypothetical protein
MYFHVASGVGGTPILCYFGTDSELFFGHALKLHCDSDSFLVKILITQKLVRMQQNNNTQRK